MAFPTVRQTKGGTSASLSSTTNSLSLDSAAIAGNLLVFCLAGDKNTGTLTVSDNIGTNAGANPWTVEVSMPSESVSLYIAWKVAVGGETGLTGTTSGSPNTGNTFFASELEQTGGGTWIVHGKSQQITAEGIGSEVSSVVIPSTSPTAISDAMAVAVATIDSLSSFSGDPDPDQNPSWTNGFVDLHIPPSDGAPGSGGGSAGCFGATANVAGGATISTTFSLTGGQDQMSGAIVVFGHDVVPVDLDDTATGTDTTTVAKTDWVDLVETATGTDVGEVFVSLPADTDTGTGTDTITVDQLFLVGPVTDSASGSDTVVVADFIGNDLTDTATGTDTVDVVRTNFVDLTDTGVAADETALLEQLNTLTDSGAGTDDLVGLGTPVVVDSGTGTDLIEITDIPFTQVLPPSRLGNLYDLIVMARIPQANGEPLFLDVDPIEWTDLQFINELSLPSQLTVGCQLGSLGANIIQRLRDLANQPTELWLYRNGRLVFTGPLQGGNANGEQVTLHAKGIMSYLRHMFVTEDLTFKDVDQATIVQSLVDHWQSQSYGHFGIDTANIAPTGVVRTATYLKTELHNIGQRIEEMGKAENGFDVEVDPQTRQLMIFFPQRGVDRSVGEDAVVFDTRNITSASVMFSAAPQDIATVAFGAGTNSVGDGTKYASAENVELMSRYGRSGVAGNFDQVAEDADLAAHVNGMLAARDAQLVVPGPDARDTPDSDLTTYSVGDTVLYQPNEVLMTTSAFRIRKQAVKVEGSGRETVSLEFV